MDEESHADAMLDHMAEVAKVMAEVAKVMAEVAKVMAEVAKVMAEAERVKDEAARAMLSADSRWFENRIIIERNRQRIAERARLVEKIDSDVKQFRALIRSRDSN